MISIDYELYTNDICRRNLTETFYSLKEFQDWIFNNCDGKYEDKISIPMPDNPIWKDGPSDISVNRMWTRNNKLCVHMIKRDGKIMFSDGTHTNSLKYWNDDAKQLCRDMLFRRSNPVFDFEENSTQKTFKDCELLADHLAHIGDLDSDDKNEVVRDLSRMKNTAPKLFNLLKSIYDIN